MSELVLCPHCGHEFHVEREAPRVTLRPGEEARAHPAGGFVIAHPGHRPLWLRQEDGAVYCERIEPAEAEAFSARQRAVNDEVGG